MDSGLVHDPRPLNIQAPPVELDGHPLARWNFSPRPGSTSFFPLAWTRDIDPRTGNPTRRGLFNFIPIKPSPSK